MPHMQDSYFGRSVVFICEHNQKGAMGLIINKPFQDPELKELFSNIFTEQEDVLEIVPTVYFGGPVLVERGIILHDSNYRREGTLYLSEDFSITSSREILHDIAREQGPENFRLMLGHAGWGAGQLEREIENGDWLLQSTTPEFVFHTDEQIMWQEAARTFGIDASQISGLGGIA